MSRDDPGNAGDSGERDDAPESRRDAVIGLVVVMVLVVVGYFLVAALREEGKREDCLMSGRTNCAPLDLPDHK